MTENTTTKTPRIRRPGLLIFFAALILAIAGAVGLNHMLGAQNLKELEETRAQLQIPDSWVLTEEKVSPPGLFGSTVCNFGATQCPQIQLEFDIPAPTENPEDLEVILPGTHWEEGDTNCDVSPNVSSASMTTCAADTHLEDTEIHVSTGGDVSGGEVNEPWVMVRIHNL